MRRLVNVAYCGCIGSVVAFTVFLGIGFVRYLHTDWPPGWFQVGLFGSMFATFAFFVATVALIGIALWRDR
ncbi:hypothetical protein NIIDNTM18_42700 [Mycolicibacterium litorale]|uniref:Uncharacterized protein n=1 Tax=Mycolicibacterium litorale TaxID=758802 RepID=A0A6S6PA50_9MYCO|nr:hypothetical protein NIIDNTM18_42700 [Mycolicibacterium litorale]